MPSLLNSVSPRHLEALVRHLEQGGFSCANALARAGLRYDMLGWRWVPVPSVLTAMQEIVEQSGRTDLGFVRGLLTPIGTTQVASQILLSAPTLRQGLHSLAPFMPLVSAVIAMRCQDEEERFLVRWSLAQPMPYPMALVALETLAVSMHRHMLFLLQQQAVHYRMSFSWTPPPHAARYRELHSPIVQFGIGGEPCVHFDLPATLADQLLLTADATTLREARQDADETLRELARRQSCGEWVEHILSTVENQLLGQDRVASLLGISGKTLARYLARENLRFGDIAKRIRQGRAERLLRTGTKSVGDIAHQLGYSTTSNFVRSFKAATGSTPERFRASPAHQ